MWHRPGTPSSFSLDARRRVSNTVRRSLGRRTLKEWLGVASRCAAVTALLLLAARPASGQTTIFAETFEAEFPNTWFTGGSSSSTTWGDNSVIADTGNWSGFCADNGSNSATGYPNSFQSFLEKRDVSLAGYSSATLTFRYYIDTEEGYDLFTVRIRNQSGQWATVFTDSGWGGGWLTRSIDLTPYAGQTGLYVRFQFDSDGSIAYDGVWVDDVRLVATGPTTKRATWLAVGDYHACAVTTAGAAQCWGKNFNGQLGDGTDVYRPTPTAVVGLSSGIAAVAGGRDHACALTTGGAVRCWGLNDHGQLGDSTTTTRLTPVPVAGLGSGVAAIAAGDNHTCAVTTTGALQCWGANASGQLGDGSTTDKTTPTTVFGSGAASVAAGAEHTCAVATNGVLWCWGDNTYGELGDGSTDGSTSPFALGGGVSSVAAGDGHTCAVTTGGALLCWGANGFGQLGDDTTTQRLRPTAVSGLSSGVAAVTAGQYHTCALTTGGGVRCWGSNTGGQLGDGTETQRELPTPAIGLGSGVSKVAAGGEYTCALVTGGAIRCWGSNTTGQLGDGSTTSRTVPTPVFWLLEGAAGVTAGQLHTCALTTAGGVSCWGRNVEGAVGDGTTTTGRTMPTPVSGLSSGVEGVAAGTNFSCAVTTSGQLRCWGANGSGQLGNGTTTDQSAPVAVTGSSGYAASVATGEAHTCALTTAETVWCWGDNSYGQLGNGSTSDAWTPTPAALGGGIASVSAGFGHTCAVTNGGALLCWGKNTLGQLGDGSTTHRVVPTLVSGVGGGVASVSTGREHTCAVTTAGAVYCWGWNADGQLGDGTTTNRLTPVPVAGLSGGVASVASGFSHTCALTMAGAVYCWGDNPTGELGDGTATDRLTPTLVTGVSSVASITAGMSHTCARSLFGTVYCWGSDAQGALGLGRRTYATSAVDVYGFGGATGIGAIVPSQGASTGGTLLGIIGDYFLQGATVSAGGTAATSVSTVNTRVLLATLGAHAPGPAAIVVTNPDGKTATLASGFSYAALAPVVTLAAPTSGPPAGGTTVFILGDHLLGASVTIGGTPATSVTALDASLLAITTPPGSAGPRDIVVSTSAGSGSLAGGFTYDPSAEVDEAADAAGTTLSPSLNADGRYLAFVSASDALVSGDTNGVADVFVRDRATDGVTRISVSSTGAQANGASGEPSISASGRYVAFVSAATNLVPGDTNAVADVFLHDRDADGNGVFDEANAVATIRVSVSSTGAQANGPSAQPDLAPEGRFVAFASSASNLVEGDTNGTDDIFLHDRVSRQTERVSVVSGGGQSNGPSRAPGVSLGGARVVFASDATNLVTGDGNGKRDVFLHERASATTVRVSTASGSGGLGDANGDSDNPSIDDAGITIAFQTLATDIVSTPATSLWQVVVFQLGAAQAVTARGDGFVADAVVDIGAALRSLASANAQGQAGNASSTNPEVSGQGGVVVFDSTSTNLVSGDTNGQRDVFAAPMRDSGGAAAPTRVSVEADGDQASGASGSAATSGNGRVTGFESVARLTAGAQGPSATQVFIRGDQLLVTKLQPASALVGATTGLVIEGAGFQPGAAVLFGTQVLSGVTVESATRIVADLPLVTTPSVFDVTVRNPDGGSATLPKAFTFSESSSDSDGDGLPDSWETQFGLDPQSGLGDNGRDGDPDGDGRTNLQEYQQGTHPRGTFTRFLAEGAATTFFSTRIALANPSPSRTAAVLLRFQKSTGAAVSHYVPVPPMQSRKVVVNEVADMVPAEFATVIESDTTLVVDRLMWWDVQNAYGTHAEAAVREPALVWYLAEGATHSGFDLFYLLQNPSPTAAAQVRVRYLRPSGAPLEKTYTVNPGSRFNIWVDPEEFPEGSGNLALANTDVSAVLEVTNNVPIIVERAMYLTKAGQTFTAGHESAGVTAPALTWFLPEGATGDLFDEFILLANPNANDATARVTYLLEDGRTFSRTMTVPANSRQNIWVDYDTPDGTTGFPLAAVALSTKVEVTNNVPIIVERAMWWPGNVTTWSEAHNSPGATATGTLWGVAEGQIQSATNTTTYLLVANTSATQASVQVTLLRENAAPLTKQFNVAPTSRLTIDVGFEFPEVANQRFGALVESLGSSPAQIAVECAMYNDALGVHWAGGSNQLATRLR